LLSEFVPNFHGTLGIANDGVTLVTAHLPGTIVVIVGTGSVALARRPSGQLLQIGGEEWIATDYGSGFWIGLKGIRAAYWALENGPQTSLTVRLLEAYPELHDRNAHEAGRTSTEAAVADIVRRLAGEGFRLKRQVASFAREVCDLAGSDDAVATRIVCEAAREIAIPAAQIYQRLIGANDEGLKLQFLVCGSIANGCKIFKKEFQASCGELLDRKVRVRPSKGGIPIQWIHDGVQEATELAAQLATGRDFRSIDDRHPIGLFGDIR
jgi:N-acetylglucosamine kinase-like BadF-type ATPase